jgi:hypothetical protein
VSLSLAGVVRWAGAVSTMGGVLLNCGVRVAASTLDTGADSGRNAVRAAQSRVVGVVTRSWEPSK